METNTHFRRLCFFLCGVHDVSNEEMISQNAISPEISGFAGGIAGSKNGCVRTSKFLGGLDQTNF
jgi:hypothetical protein